MELVVKTFMGLFFLLFLMLVGVELIGALANTEKARDFKNMAVTEIENSDYDPVVINELIASAEDEDFGLTVSLKNSDGESFVITDRTNATIDMTRDVAFASLKLEYDYSIPLFNASSPHVLYSLMR
ncbi:MAG: hypothetical protein K6F37_09160 [Lachnospiraceae bacterium]|nr:hypothetical protein [Lachnospiraceae bacterium]